MSSDTISFIKMHGIGNDVMFIDLTFQTLVLSTSLIQSWADRHKGIGFDQLLVLEPYQGDDADFIYRIFNADGSEVEQCGNGARCVAYYLQQKRGFNQPILRLKTINRIVEARFGAENSIEISLGIPDFSPASLPFVTNEIKDEYQQSIDHTLYIFKPLSVGNPHVVIQVDDIQQAPVDLVGSHLSRHELFPRGTNVGFYQVINAKTLALRVYERGVGETLACGSGAAAAMITAYCREQVESTVTVQLPGGDLYLQWAGFGTPIYLRGRAEIVFEGEILCKSFSVK